MICQKYKHPSTDKFSIPVICQEELEKYRTDLEAAENQIEILEQRLKEQDEAKAKLEAKLGLSSALDSEMTSFGDRMDEEREFQMKSLYDANESMEKQVTMAINH